MKRLFVVVVTVIGLCAIAGCGRSSTSSSSYELVIANGRVIDPESGLDAVRHLGIRDGKIAAVSETALRGKRVIDAADHVVAPGFIDMHQHGQHEEAYRLAVRDGVTTMLELEVGTADVHAWYAALDGGQPVNYGVSVGHIPARMKVMGDPGTLLPVGVGGSGTANEEQIAAMEKLLQEGLAQGALALGFGTAYTPGAPMTEIERMFRVGAQGNACAHVHMRGGLAGLRETIEAARSAGACLHVVHVNSSGGDELEAFLAAIQAARNAGQDVTTETYPYGASLTEIQSALFDDWETWPDDKFPLHQMAATGERLTRKAFPRARAGGGMVVMHVRSEEQTRTAVASPLTMIASDGHILDGHGHPRSAGTYARVLGRYVREEGLLDLTDALRRMTIEPARRLEHRTPAMAGKGRIRVGADADVTVFDPRTVIDRATYEEPALPSAGIPYVVVGGQVVVDNGEVTDARPGRAVRAPQAP